MNWPLFLQLIVTAVVAFSGAWLAHAFAANRDRKNKRRDQRISYLIEAYRRLESASNRASLDSMQKVESAAADIQLFGSVRQIHLVQSFVHEFATTKTASLDLLLEELRKDLRVELQLENVSSQLVYVRWTPDSDKPNG